MIQRLSKILLTQISPDNNIPLRNEFFKTLKPGNVLHVLYKTVEGTKEKVHSYEGLLIAKKNSNLSKSITLRRIVQGIGVEQSFPFNSPNLIECKIQKTLGIQKSKNSRRSKLYYLRTTKK